MDSQDIGTDSGDGPGDSLPADTEPDSNPTDTTTDTAQGDSAVDSVGADSDSGPGSDTAQDPALPRASPPDFSACTPLPTHDLPRCATPEECPCGPLSIAHRVGHRVEGYHAQWDEGVCHSESRVWGREALAPVVEGGETLYRVRHYQADYHGGSVVHYLRCHPNPGWSEVVRSEDYDGFVDGAPQNLQVVAIRQTLKIFDPPPVTACSFATEVETTYPLGCPGPYQPHCRSTFAETFAIETRWQHLISARGTTCGALPQSLGLVPVEGIGLEFGYNVTPGWSPDARHFAVGQGQILLHDTYATPDAPPP